MFGRLNIPSEDIVDDVESDEAIIERQKVFLQNLVNSHPMHENVSLGPILVVTHGRFLKIFLKHFCSLNITTIENCSTTTVHLNIRARISDFDTTSLDDLREETPPAQSVTGDSLFNVVAIDVNNTSHLRNLEERNRSNS